MTSDHLYDTVVDVWRKSVFTGGEEVKEETTLDALLASDIPLLVEFAKDNDIQYVKVVSTNIGMIRIYQKRYVRNAAPEPEEEHDQ